MNKTVTIDADYLSAKECYLIITRKDNRFHIEISDEPTTLQAYKIVYGMIKGTPKDLSPDSVLIISNEQGMYPVPFGHNEEV